VDYGNLGGEMFQKHLMFLLGSDFWILLSTGNGEEILSERNVFMFVSLHLPLVWYFTFCISEK